MLLECVFVVVKKLRSLLGEGRPSSTMQIEMVIICKRHDQIMVISLLVLYNLNWSHFYISSMIFIVHSLVFNCVSISISNNNFITCDLLMITLLMITF